LPGVAREPGFARLHFPGAIAGHASEKQFATENKGVSRTSASLAFSRPDAPA
jgi:hypothetical protein